jgi:hypothetical protein
MRERTPHEAFDFYTAYLRLGSLQYRPILAPHAAPHLAAGEPLPDADIATYTNTTARLPLRNSEENPLPLRYLCFSSNNRMLSRNHEVPYIILITSSLDIRV